MVRIELTVSCAQDTRATGALHPEYLIDPCGIRTQPLRLERPATSPEVERAVLCAHRVRKVGQEALESSSAGFQPAAKPSQLPTRDREGYRSQQKEPGVACVTPGFEKLARLGADVTCAGDTDPVRWKTGRYADPYSLNSGQSDVGTGGARIALRDRLRVVQTTSYRSAGNRISAVKAS